MRAMSNKWVGENGMFTASALIGAGFLVCALGLALAGCNRQEGGTGGEGAAERKGGSKGESGGRVAGSKGCPDPFAVPESGEGMWPWADLRKLDEKELRGRGLEVSLEELWTPGEGGIASGVVGLRGCTASFVSPDGLLLTNHHCAYSAIQRNSTDADDLLKQGFVAKSRDEELDGYGVRVLVFRNQKNVTDEIVDGLDGKLSDLEIVERIEEREKKLVARCEEKPNTRCQISRENNGLRFLLMENLEIKDVRLVAAPPQSLGSYGGEVDNWHWPRHTLDFTLLRAYVSKKGEVRGYDEKNVPYRPKHHLKINRAGISDGDFIMVLGRPYHTARYRTSVAVEQQRDWYYPTRLKLFKQWIAVLEKTSREIPTARIPVSTTIKGLHNALTNAEGMIAGLERRRIVELKKRQEKAWRAWIAGDPERKKKWGASLDELIDYLKKSTEGRDRDLLIRYMLRGVKLLRFARVITKWAQEQKKPDQERDVGYQKRDREMRLARLRNAQRSLHVEADKRVFALFLRWLGKLEKDERIEPFEKALGGDYSKESIARFVERVYGGTSLGELDSRVRMFGQPETKLEQSNDTMIQLASSLGPVLDAYEKRLKERQGAFFRLRRPYLQSLIEFRGRQFYPDANASPRISFAEVTGYSPRDGVYHLPFTSLAGLVAKHTGKRPFDAPERFLEAVRSKTDGGEYVSEELGDVPACFLSNADTTGGNSGSPVLDSRGRLVGLNFDRVYSNIAGDFGYSPARSRNIMVDIRFVLWYLDRVLKAEPLVDELTADTSKSEARR